MGPFFFIFSIISILFSSFLTSCVLKPDETPSPNESLNVHFFPDYNYTFVTPLLEEALPFKQGDKLKLSGWRTLHLDRISRRRGQEVWLSSNHSSA